MKYPELMKTNRSEYIIKMSTTIAHVEAKLQKYQDKKAKYEQKVKRMIKELEALRAEASSDTASVVSDTTSVDTDTTSVGITDYSKINEYTTILHGVDKVMCAKSRKHIIIGNGIELTVVRNESGMVIGFKHNTTTYNSPTRACHSIFNQKWGGPNHIFFKNENTWKALKKYN